MRPPRAYAFAAVALAASVSLGADNAPAPTNRPFLYRIAREAPSHLFGTIHLPDERVLALNPAVTDALASSTTFYSEIKLDGSGLAEFVETLAEDSAGVPPLRERLSPELYSRLDIFVRSRGVPIQVFEAQPTWMVTVMLPLMSYMTESFASQPLDQKLALLAADQGQQLAGLEQASEQVAVFSGPTEEEQVRMLDNALAELEGADVDPVEPLIQAYLSGDETALAEVLEAMSNQSDPAARALYERLLHDRSRTMSDRIARILGDHPDTPFFFAIGAGHLPGPKGVLALLRQHGLTVDRVTPASR